jgi:methylmalonyl-CoA mutase N-terminal domain/subunit
MVTNSFLGTARQVIDPWGGSYMMEKLTDDLATKALEIINEVCRRTRALEHIVSSWLKRMHDISFTG